MVWQGKEEDMESMGAKGFLKILKGDEMVDSVPFDGRESLLLGRHGNCDVLVAHPSISRQHLHIQLLPRSRQFILTDLDSVHGTVVNGRNLPPLSPLTAGEGDSFQLGASSRVYTIQWKVEDKDAQSPEPIVRKASLERARKKVIYIAGFFPNLYTIQWKVEDKDAQSPEPIVRKASLERARKKESSECSSLSLKENSEEILRHVTATTKPSNLEKRVPFAPLQQNKANARSSPGSPISAKKKKRSLPPLPTQKMKSETSITNANKKEEGVIIMNATAKQSEGERGGKHCPKPCLSSIEEEEEKEEESLLLADNNSTLVVMEKEEEKVSEVMVIVSPPQSCPSPSANSYGYGSSSSSSTEKIVVIEEDSSTSIEKEKESAMELAVKIAILPHPPTNSYGTSSLTGKSLSEEKDSSNVMDKEEEKVSEVMVIVSPPRCRPSPSANSYGSLLSSSTEKIVLIEEDSSSSIEKEKESAMELAVKIAIPPHPPTNSYGTSSLTERSLSEEKDSSNVMDKEEKEWTMELAVKTAPPHPPTNSYGTSSLMEKKVMIEDRSEKEKESGMELAVKIALPPHPPSNSYGTLSSTEIGLPKEEDRSNAMEKEKESAMEFIVKTAPPHLPTNSYGTSSSTEKRISIEEDVMQIVAPFCKDVAFDSRKEKREEEEEEEEEYPSDKENLPPYSTLLTKGQEGQNNNRTSCEQLSRRPLQPLQLSLFRPSSPTLSYSVEGKNDDYCHGSFGFSEHSQQPTASFVVAQNLDHMLQRLKLLDEVEALHRQWHIVIDTSCLIDAVSFDSVKQLEGIKDTRLIVPKIVIWELDGMSRREGSKSALEALKWIESCMVKVPFWIHVQNSAETSSAVIVGLTPPASPLHSSVSSGDYSIMSPTNHDLVLDCTLLFSRSIMEGQMALLTNNTTLKIKTMAEGMITCESAQVFCESLLSPYSERFLWSQSTARGRYWIQRPITKRTTCSSSSPTRKKLGKHHHHHHHQELKNHCSQSLLGLKVLLE